MLENLTEKLKGVLEGCVPEIISRGETYGYEITQRLNASASQMLWTERFTTFWSDLKEASW